MNGAFLSVAHSLSGRRWTDRLDGAAQREALTMAQAHGLSEALARILAARGVTLAGVETFLDPTLRRLMPDPSTLRDMDAAVQRLAAAISARENVAIFGDYDVDGAASAALLALFLRAYGVPVKIHIPDRIREGYGPNVEAIRALAREGATLLVTVDCGISSHGPLGEAQAMGMDAVVLDHHLAPEQLPSAVALVNPNRQDDVSGLDQLAACGVVFMTLVALQRRLRGMAGLKGQPPDLMGMLDIVALGTVADVVPLTGLNRAFVRQGLKVLRQRNRPGLAALMDAAGLKEPPEAWHLGFLLGPRINAGGRIGDAALGARLLTLDDPAEAARIAQELDRLNRERQVIEQITVEQAVAAADVEQVKHGLPPVIIAGGTDWHPGVVGLVASRLKERFQRPALAIAWDEQEGPDKVEVVGVGSARSVPGVDLGRAVRAAAEQGLIVKGGGHAMAAGLTLRRDQLDALKAFLSEALGADVTAADASQALQIDGALTAGSLTTALAADMARAGPFGQGNPEPLFVLPAHEITDVTAAGTAHLRFRFRSGDGSSGQGIAFRAQGQPLGDGLMRLKGRRAHLAGTLKVDRWGGRERVDLRLVDAAEAA